MKEIAVDRDTSGEHTAFMLNELATLKSPMFVFSELTAEPTGDVQVRIELEALLNNDSPCLVAIPYSFGEIRYLAGQALAAERYRAGIMEPVRLHGVIVPVESNKLGLLAEHEGIRAGGGMEGQLKEFTLLRARDLLPCYDIDMMVQNGYVEFVKCVQINAAVLPATD